MKNCVIGCIADDFTGAADAASFLASGGMDTILCSGIPTENCPLPDSCEAIVIALKSRTAPVSQAVAEALASLEWLKAQGAEHFYFKYCSTFDSTPEGNIGPVMDALIEELDAPISILCPALPANGRLVRDGILYVGGVPLAESSMKDHPLTPMRKSRIAELMKPQSRYDCLELHSSLLHGCRADLAERIRTFAENRRHCYLIPDYCDDSDAALLAELFGSWPLLSGGSGLLTALAEKLRHGSPADPLCPGTVGPALIVAGSCSAATLAQREYFLARGGSALQLTDDMLNAPTFDAAGLWDRCCRENRQMVFAYDTPEGLARKRTPEGAELAARIENALADAAAEAVKAGVTRIIAAGGETSGAVIRALGLPVFRIGPNAAPGVPVLIPVGRPELRVILKSGNFGKEDFFVHALEMTQA